MDKNKLKVFNKSNFHSWEEKLNHFFNLVVNGTDKLAKNYTINYDELDELTLITYEDKIVAFSSILGRDTWPSNVRRVFNRFVRNKELEWSDNTFGTLSKIMHDEQIKYCENNNIDFAFLSIQNSKKNYVKRWTTQANLHSPLWVQIDGMVRMTDGKPINSIQHVTYKDVKGLNRNFPMEVISYKEYESLLN
jgi:hypothetical protein